MRKFYRIIRRFFWDTIRLHYPYFWAKKRYKLELGSNLNLSNPKDINEKILWLEFFTDTRLWSILADKYAVRDYVKERVGEEYLIPLLGKWDRAEHIDFEQLPDKFVLKPNNGSYNVIIVKDKKTVDIAKIGKQLNHSLLSKFGLDNAEPHYLYIKPLIIAEQLLETDSVEGIVDYKIWCFDGEPLFIHVCANRDPITHHCQFIYYDLQWNRYPDYITEPYRNDCICAKPDNLPELLDVAAKLSKGLPQCRVDLYNIDGKIYFGELTLTSNYGMMPYFIQKVLDDMGSHCVLPCRTLKDRIFSFKTRYLPKF